MMKAKTLSEALEPFAKMADLFDHYECDPGQPEKYMVSVRVKLMDLRRARETFVKSGGVITDESDIERWL